MDGWMDVNVGSKEQEQSRAEQSNSDAGAGEGAGLGEDDDAAFAGDVAFHQVLPPGPSDQRMSELLGLCQERESD